MRSLLALAVAVLLAGCSSGGSGIEAFVAQPSDLPEQYDYVDMASENGSFLRQFKMATNPGEADPEALGAPGVERVYVAAYTDHEGSLILSAALQFASANATQQAVQEFADDLCGDGEGVSYVLGKYVGAVAVFAEGADGAQVHAQEAADRVMLRTGAVDVCA